jgi:hypothetical protein
VRAGIVACASSEVPICLQVFEVPLEVANQSDMIKNMLSGELLDCCALSQTAIVAAKHLQLLC